MSKITAQVPSLTPPVEDAVMKNPPRLPSIRTGPFRQIVAVVASLRLTVTLFTFGVLLVFFGTLAQMDEGLWAVLRNYFRTFFIAWIPNQTLVRFGQVFFGVSKDAVLPGSFPLPGGFLIGSLMLVNLVAAYATRFRYTWKRAGVLMLHGGVILLMLGEFYYGSFGIESRMRIPINGSSNFIEHHDKVELAVIERINPKEDKVVVIPGSILSKRGTIQDERLPFDIEVNKYMANVSVPTAPPAGTDNPATEGIGKVFYVSEAALTPGTDGQRSDHPSAYVTFREKGSGRSLGTYLVSTWLADLSAIGAPVLRGHVADPDDATQLVTVNNKPFEVSLRAERYYKPYTLTLKEFRHDRYPGTEIPKNYSSLVQLVDPARHENREVKIYMNSPLRYEGEAFYQSGVLGDDAGTILQVVRNEGWLLPYVACSMVTLGMLYHFGVLLLAFLKKVQAALDAAREKLAKRTALEQYLPWGVFGFAAFCVMIMAMGAGSATREEMHLDEFARLPVMDGGRIMPMDTIARTRLMGISNRQEFKDDKGNMRPAVQWLLDALTSSEVFRRANEKEPRFSLQGDYDKVFRIENPEVLALFGLPERPGDYRYSIDEMRPKGKVFAEQAHRARDVPADERTTFDTKLVELGQRLEAYEDLTSWHTPLAVPPERTGASWQSLAQTWNAAIHGQEKDPAARAYLRILFSYATNDAKEFNAGVREYRDQLAGLVPSETNTAAFETFYNRFQVFMISLVLFVIALVLTFAGWVCLACDSRPWASTFNRTAFGLIVLAFTIHTTGIVTRMVIMDRYVPITNLYTTAIFIGWACVILGLVLEQWFPLGIGNFVASLLGFLTAFIAHHLAHGDTMEVLQAVLDTNFWLATHVTCINFGYAATLFAGFLGMGYIAVAWATKWVDVDESVFKALSQMIYGVVCFAMILSFTGTVLGGIWADQSWGRFWGWDPKENGALLIVLVNAIVLHARWGGIVKQRGIAMLTVVGNMVTAWSWFGTNQLGVGLHAYGFNKTLATCLVWFWASQLVMIGLGLLLPYARLNYPGGRGTQAAG
jgi:ABC-type transport system involved in cytochrome c biogenesis permease subunit